MQLLSLVKRDHPNLPVVMISGHGNVETAVAAIKEGAYDFIEKPFKADRLLLVIARAIEAMRLRRENDELRQRSGSDAELIGSCSIVAQLRQAIERVAPTGSRVLITGPAGSGKEVAARMLHRLSRRIDGPFVALNCATMHPDRLEVELFGHEESEEHGPAKIGTLEQAHGGTLLLDEVSDMPLETQAKILRVLVEQRFQRLGGGPKVHVDVRVVSSTSHDLQKEMTAGRLREDHYHRLNVVPVRVPGLSERREDVPDLVRYFVQTISVASGLPPRRIGEDAMAVLQSHDWPGNVRQLRNNVERLMILVGGDPDSIITADMLPDEIVSPVPLSPNGAGGEHLMSLPLRDAREIFEREYLLAQVNRFGGNISRTAEFVGMERSALHRKLRALGVNSNERSPAMR
jgi:two-component system nitrogen regulation response regulator NtrX